MVLRSTVAALNSQRSAVVVVEDVGDPGADLVHDHAAVPALVAVAGLAADLVHDQGLVQNLVPSPALVPAVVTTAPRANHLLTV